MISKILFFAFIFPSNLFLFAGEVNSWECSKFENAKVYGSDDEYLGELGPSWLSDSIYNSYSSYASSWSSNSIFNDNSKYGNNYSDSSVFNENASNPPKIIKDSEIIGYLSIGPSWVSDRYNPFDIKYTCDWD